MCVTSQVGVEFSRVVSRVVFARGLVICISFVERKDMSLLRST